MDDKVAIVTGGLSGLGRAMALGLARSGVRVLAVGHIAGDAEQLHAEVSQSDIRGQLVPMLGDLRRPTECNRIIDMCRAKFGRFNILVNAAGLTFTFIWPGLYRRTSKPKFWEVTDDIVQAVMDTNFVAADQMGRRAAPIFVKQGWGRIINVTTRLETMNRPTTGPYGPSKAALEIATEVWAQELASTGVTANILNPGAGAHTPGMAVEASEASRTGKMPRFIEPDEMVPPLLWLVSPEADAVTGYRFDAITWDTSLDPTAAARKNARKAGFDLHREGAAF